jgi:hypothetical protein
MTLTLRVEGHGTNRGVTRTRTHASTHTHTHTYKHTYTHSHTHTWLDQEVVETQGGEASHLNPLLRGVCTRGLHLSTHIHGSVTHGFAKHGIVTRASVTNT